METIKVLQKYEELASKLRFSREEELFLYNLELEICIALRNDFDDECLKRLGTLLITMGE